MTLFKSHPPKFDYRKYKYRRRNGMARIGRPSTAVAAPAQGSDYGSDIDTDTELQIAPLLAGTIADSDTPLVLESIEQDAGNEFINPVAHVPKSSSQQSERDLERELKEYMDKREERRQHSIVVEYDEPSRRAWSGRSMFSQGCALYLTADSD